MAKGKGWTKQDLIGKAGIRSVNDQFGKGVDKLLGNPAEVPRKKAVPKKSSGPKLNTQIIKRMIEQELQVRVKLEHKFHDKRKWRIDIAVFGHNGRIAIELEGGVFTRGRHLTGVGFLKDIEKYNALTLYGWRLLRYTHSHHQYYEIINDLRKII